MLSKVKKKSGITSTIIPPYRESKLTRILKDCLQGNGKSHILVTVNPTKFHAEETMNTLRFAQTAQHVKTQLKKNKLNSGNIKTIRKLENEIKYLKQILNLKSKGAGMADLVYKFKELKEENERLKKKGNQSGAVKMIMEENKRLRSQLKRAMMEGVGSPLASPPGQTYDLIALKKQGISSGLNFKSKAAESMDFFKTEEIKFGKEEDNNKNPDPEDDSSENLSRGITLDMQTTTITQNTFSVMNNNLQLLRRKQSQKAATGTSSLQQFVKLKPLRAATMNHSLKASGPSSARKVNKNYNKFLGFDIGYAKIGIRGFREAIHDLNCTYCNESKTSLYSNSSITVISWLFTKKEGITKKAYQIT